MTSPLAPDGSGQDGTDPLVSEARHNFIAGFASRCDSLASLIVAVGASGAEGPTTSLRLISHRVAGLAGTLGFPGVTAAARELEATVLTPGQPFDHEAARAALARMRASFTRELAQLPAESSSPARPGRLLVVDDDAAVRTTIRGVLEKAGYEVLDASNGRQALTAARDGDPDAVLLDIEMPGIDGREVCRALKAHPDLSSVAVLLMTSHEDPAERLAGLMLGADDYLTKPVDPADLLLRVSLRLAQRHQRAGGRTQTPMLAYDAFVLAARELFERGPAALVLLSVPAASLDAAAQALLGEVRRQDLLAPYDSQHLLILLPGLDAASLPRRVAGVTARLNQVVTSGVHAGVAIGAPPAARFEALLAEADEALADARARGVPFSGRGQADVLPRAASRRIVIAEDESVTAKLVESHLQSAGYRTMTAANGQAALRAVLAEKPALLVLDLWMPGLSGFDVLARLQEVAEDARPKVLVLSAGREADDVARAFELGAHDYLAKPVRKQELLARVARFVAP